MKYILFLLLFSGIISLESRVSMPRMPGYWPSLNSNITYDATLNSHGYPIWNIAKLTEFHMGLKNYNHLSDRFIEMLSVANATILCLLLIKLYGFVLFYNRLDHITKVST